jgi:hypothetical protein
MRVAETSPFGLYTICGGGLITRVKNQSDKPHQHLRGEEHQHMSWAITGMGRTTGSTQYEPAPDICVQQ